MVLDHFKKKHHVIMIYKKQTCNNKAEKICVFQVTCEFKIGMVDQNFFYFDKRLG